MDVETVARHAGQGPQKGKSGPAKPPDKTLALFALLLFVGLVVVFLPTAVLFAVGMVPSMVAYVVDVTPGRYAARCVAGLNLAGISPYLHSLWTGRNDMDATVAIISDPYAWLVFYGASGVGWLMFLGVPSLVATIQVLDAQRQVNALRDQQKLLVREWGDEVRVEALQSLHMTSDDEAMVDSAAAQADSDAGPAEGEVAGQPSKNG